ncbi:hypothetical protein KIW84_031096 [Lathyrus oleraceus]|uniref:MULE transposase domain-containing protein n=1 Tax=Pisum sativum TaxID=3888 RepID=A0A9D4XUF6_PEA|nr:hypothetical protein KIW84_031096 [Pisum sativum]
MDNTYKTDKYRQPLFEIVGMTSTELTFAVAFAYMESEQTENFCWVLEKLKELFVKKDLCPQVILTDRDLALMKAIEIVFLRSINLLCKFHINKNVGAKCKQHVVNDLQKTIYTLWMEVVWASDEVEYGQRLHQLEQACVDYSGFINYVKDTWLTPHRHRFVGAWINRVLHLGNTTTNRLKELRYFVVRLTSANGEFCRKKSTIPSGMAGGSKHVSNAFLNFTPSLGDLAADFFNMASFINSNKDPS